MTKIELNNVQKIYGTKKKRVTALDNLDLTVKKGEFLVVRGPSGSGKTTLLLTIGGMLHPTAGTVTVNGHDIYAMTERDRAGLRKKNIGFVFQEFHLIPYLNVLDNVLVGYGGGSTGLWKTKAADLLKRLNLQGRAGHKPAELSTGESQRTAIARALLTRPEIILADEPTGNLDPETGAEVLKCLADYHKEGGTVILVTHGKEAEDSADRVINFPACCRSQ